MVPFRSHVPPLLFLTGIFLITFLARIVLAPLLPAIEGDLNIGHGEAGSFFLLISLGYVAGLLGSLFVSCFLTHRKTIVLSSMVLSGSLLAISLSNTLWGIRAGLILVGLAAGLYLPSGIATLTAMVSSRDFGKAIAIHELAPNVGLMAAPVVAEVLMIWFSWRGVIALLAGTAVIVGVTFIRFGRGGTFRGEAPSANTLRVLLAQPSLWVMVIFFGLGIGVSLGVYTMLPLYLVAERGLERSWANQLVAFSRIAGPAVTFIGGWVSDRLGPKRALAAVFLTTGVVTILLATARGLWIGPIVILQAMLTVCFFPPAFAALSRIIPPEARNVAVSLTIPMGNLVGGGVIPAGIGLLGEKGFFSLGIMLVGMLVLGSIILLRYLRFHEDTIQ